MRIHDGAVDTGHNITDAFKAVYFHLYSNGQASRAERIVEDLTLVLLAKLAAERLDRFDDILAVIRGDDPDRLLTLVAKEFPQAFRDTDKFGNDPGSIRHALGALERVELSGAPAHVIGHAFQSVMGPRVRGDKGQFFTPRTLVRSMVEVLRPSRSESVADPAAGTGGFLAETYQFRGNGGTGPLVGVDKDYDMYRLATAMLGIVAADDATAFNFNALSLDEWRTRFDSDRELFDVILTNPPFGSKIGITDKAMLSRFDFGHLWVDGLGGWHRTTKTATSRDPQILFLELCVRLLKPNGRMGIVLPEGVFGNKGVAFVWHWLRERGNIEALLDCPRTTFLPGTDTKTNVLFFKKGGRQGPTRVAVALTCGHDRRGRTHRADGMPQADDFVRIGKDYHRKVSSTWRSVDLAGRSYLVPRYYEVPEPASAEEASLLEGAEWATLGELTEKKYLRIRKGHEPGSDAYGTGEIPFVRTSDLANFEVNSDPTKAVSEAIYQQYRDVQALAPGDILMVVDGRYRIGSAAMVTKRTMRCVVQSHLRILSVDPNNDQIDPYSLLYALSLSSVKRRVRDLVFVQSTLGTLGKRIFELRVPLLGRPGPWRQTVEEFRNVLVQRDLLLARLSERSVDSYEL
jgi:type I restriction enzyme M protein